MLAWYWWVLIGLGLVGLAVLKLTIFKKMVETKKAREQAAADRDE